MPNTLKSARPASLLSMNGYSSTPRQLGGQQDRGRFPAGEREHAGKLASGPVAIATGARPPAPGP